MKLISILLWKHMQILWSLSDLFKLQTNMNYFIGIIIYYFVLFLTLFIYPWKINYEIVCKHDEIQRGIIPLVSSSFIPVCYFPLPLSRLYLATSFLRQNSKLSYTFIDGTDSNIHLPVDITHIFRLYTYLVINHLLLHTGIWIILLISV
jgi:hypothetical protein